MTSHRAPSSRVAKWHQRHLEASRIIRPMARALEFLGDGAPKKIRNSYLGAIQTATLCELNISFFVAILVDVFVIFILYICSRFTRTAPKPTEMEVYVVHEW